MAKKEETLNVVELDKIEKEQSFQVVGQPLTDEVLGYVDVVSRN